MSIEVELLLFSYLLLSGITTGALYALVAIGLVVVNKSTGIINFAQGELVMVCDSWPGQFMSSSAKPILSPSSGRSSAVSCWVSLPIELPSSRLPRPTW